MKDEKETNWKSTLTWSDKETRAYIRANEEKTIRLYAFPYVLGEGMLEGKAQAVEEDLFVLFSGKKCGDAKVLKYGQINEMEFC